MNTAAFRAEKRRANGFFHSKHETPNLYDEMDIFKTDCSFFFLMDMDTR